MVETGLSDNYLNDIQAARRDSTGSCSEARLAGRYPKMIPTAADTPKATSTEKGVTMVRISAK
jgi:hypothetical protein